MWPERSLRGSWRRRAGALAVLLAACPACGAAARGAADLVVLDARIDTVAAGHAMADALAVRDGVLVFVGARADAAGWIGPRTRVLDLGGRLVLPGLADSHLHPLDTVELDVCDLRTRPLALEAISRAVRACLARYHTPRGAWLRVQNWSYASGNAPSPGYATLREALDRASREVAIELSGDDGHHGAYNSVALALARAPGGPVLGLSGDTLAGPYAEYRRFVGVDAHGEPDGFLIERARYLVNPVWKAYTNGDIAAVLAHARAIPERMARAGITLILDASATTQGLAVYDALLARGELTLRASLAQYFDPVLYRTPTGAIDYAGILAEAQANRAHFAASGLVRAEFIKLYADGALEGDPRADPPTLPNAALLRPYLQPRFASDPRGRPTVTGYVDTDSAACREVRARPEAFAAEAAVHAFRVRTGHHPAQCTQSDGELTLPYPELLEYARRAHVAGFNLHLHVIGDRAARAAIDAIEAARAADGNSATRDGLAHVQLAHPDDVLRMGRDHLYLAYTYSWAYADPDYDMLVVPFLEHVRGNGLGGLYDPGHYYDRNAYPVRASQQAGAILVAGSDAPVASRDPRPFVNMMMAVTRRAPGMGTLNAGQSISLRAVIEAYTIDGARMAGLERTCGSLEVGKSADFIVLDRDVLALADRGTVEAVAGTRVLMTYFQGRPVYTARGFTPGGNAGP